MASFRHQGKRLAYRTYGSGPRAVILLPGLLLPARMHEPLAQALADRGNRVVLLDLLGHGRSDRPRDMWRYSMRTFGEEVLALMDHLELDQAVIGGTSLGANTTLEVASQAPERVRGMVIEMPVLDNAILACAAFFTPILVGLTFGAPVTRRIAGLLQRVPQAPLPFYAGVGLDWFGQDPGPSAASSRACSSAASPPTAPSAARSRPRRWSSGTTATRSTRSPTPACWPTSFPTPAWSRRSR